jgi:hypothetical protein
MSNFVNAGAFQSRSLTAHKSRNDPVWSCRKQFPAFSSLVHCRTRGPFLCSCLPLLMGILLGSTNPVASDGDIFFKKFLFCGLVKSDRACITEIVDTGRFGCLGWQP